MNSLKTTERRVQFALLMLGSACSHSLPKSGHSQPPNTFTCPESITVFLSTPSKEGYELYSERLELSSSKGQIALAKFALYSGHPRKMGILKAHNTKDEPIYWEHLESSRTYYLGCSYADDGHFQASNLAVVQVRGDFKRCTSLPSGNGIFCE